MMRKVVFTGLAAALAVGGSAPAAAQGRGTIVHDGPHPVPHVRLHRPDARVVIRREVPMRDRIGSFDTRDYIRDPIVLDRRGYGDGYGYADDHGDDDAYEDRYDRGVRYGDARDIDYDRSYPYDHPYGGGYGAGPYGFGGYTVTETITTTTTPTIIKQIEYVEAPVAVHSPARYKKTRRVHRTARRSIKGPRR